MELFEQIFKPETIYNTLFLDIKVVAEYATSEEFSDKNPKLHDKWADIANKKYGFNDNRTYHQNAVNFPEFSKISNITIGVIEDINGDMKRTLESMKGTEEEMIKQFFQILNGMVSSGKKKYLCGHVVSGHHIPFLIKRGLKYGITIPNLFKKALVAKPWNSELIDTSLIWKFNSIGFNSLDMIADFLNLKTNVTLRKADVISEFYYNSKGDDKWLETQSMNETNLLIQILRKMREV